MVGQEYGATSIALEQRALTALHGPGDCAVDRALEELRQAVSDLAFAEAADLIARHRAAQRRLRNISQMPDHFGCACACGRAGAGPCEDAADQIQQALRFDAEAIADIARQEARARLSDGFAALPIALPVSPRRGGDTGTTAAQVARRLVEDARRRLC